MSLNIIQEAKCDISFPYLKCLSTSLNVLGLSYMFSDVFACFSVGPAALCKQIEDWRQLLFDLFTLKSRKTIMTPSGYFRFNNVGPFSLSLTVSRRLSMNRTRVWTHSMLTPRHCSEPGSRGPISSTSRHCRGSADSRLTVCLVTATDSTSW